MAAAKAKLEELEEANAAIVDQLQCEAKICKYSGCALLWMSHVLNFLLCAVQLKLELAEKARDAASDDMYERHDKEVHSLRDSINALRGQITEQLKAQPQPGNTPYTQPA